MCHVFCTIWDGPIESAPISYEREEEQTHEFDERLESLLCPIHFNKSNKNECIPAHMYTP